MMKTHADGIAVAPPLTATAIALTFDDRWTMWEARGARHDALVARNVRLFAAMVATAGLIWAALSMP